MFNPISLHVVILAAGYGKRMHSSLPKVLHLLAGKPLLEYVIEAALALEPEGVHVVVGNGGEQVQHALSHCPVQWVVQKEQLGTGHAVLQALPHIPSTAHVLVLCGDCPNLHPNTLRALLNQSISATASSSPSLGLLLATMTNPKGLGRIIRDEHGVIQGIVEERDANPTQQLINEIYSGVCCVGAHYLKQWLPSLSKDNAQGEYYLTEIIPMAIAEGLPIVSLAVTDPIEVAGVNDRVELHRLEREKQRQIADSLMLSGVSLADAQRLDVRGTLTCGKDVFIDVNVVIMGKVHIGDNCIIGPNCCLRDVTIGANTQVFAHSLIEQCNIGESCHIGPFARIRPGTTIANNCKIGNFVELKNAVIDENSKANHLSYLGDVQIGKHVNVGAGTITCNYDGANKHLTIIEDGVFIGSDTQLVAPIRVGAYATIGAGTTLRKEAPAGELTLTEARQKTLYGWKRPKKQTPTREPIVNREKSSEPEE